jgi:hypothetical protein
VLTNSIKRDGVIWLIWLLENSITFQQDNFGIVAKLDVCDG